MPDKPAKELIVRRSSQIRALSSPLRQSIADALKRLGRGSIREIAAELGRPPATLYYHVRQLERAKLIEKVEQRDTARRPEAVYALVAERIRLDRGRRGVAWRREVARLVRCHLRAIERALLRHLEAGEEGHEDLAQLRAQRVRMGDADRRELQRRLVELSEFAERAAERADQDDPVISLVVAHAPSPDADRGTP